MIGKIIDETVLMNPQKVEYSKVPDCILECEFCLKFLEDTKMIPGAENKTGNYEAYIALELVSTRVHSDSKKGLDPVGMMNLNIADNGGQSEMNSWTVLGSCELNFRSTHNL